MMKPHLNKAPARKDAAHGLEVAEAVLLDVKADDDGVYCLIEGYASVYGVKDNGADIVIAGAFDNALKQKAARDVRMLWNHDPATPIGKWTEIVSDDRGLFVKGRINCKVAAGRDAAELSRDDAIGGLSIGYRTLQARPNQQKGARELLEVDLWEISLVTFPMLPAATLTSVKSESVGTPTIREIERVMMGTGLGAAAVKTILANGLSGLTETLVRDAKLSGAEAELLLKSGFKDFADARDAEREAKTADYESALAELRSAFTPR